MRIVLSADPALLERPGSIRTEVLETLAALRALGPQAGIEACLAGAGAGADGDVAHLFGAGPWLDGAAAGASASGVPLVLSPRLAPGMNAASLRRALEAARLVVVPNEAQRQVLSDACAVPPSKASVVPRGVAARFCDADPALFRNWARIGGRFALMVGRIAPSHDQLGVASMLAELALPLVAIGTAQKRDSFYLRELRALRTVTCIGPLAHDDALLASAYAAASVFVPAAQASTDMAQAEARAAGTPVAVPGDPHGFKQAVSNLLERPPRREPQRAPGWTAAAQQLVQCYREVLAVPA